jgi:succinate dehydrogenase/fumarate reductase flavoprotein subunit
VTGFWAGEGAARDAENVSARNLVNKQVEKLAKEIKDPLIRKKGITFDFLYKEIIQMTRRNVGIFMHRDKLQDGIKKIETFNKEKAQKLIAEDPHELAKVKGLKNMAEVLELMMRAYLYREESRGGFVREDYPETDNINWLKWITMKREGKGLIIKADPIPIETYSLKPKREKIIHPIFKS